MSIERELRFTADAPTQGAAMKVLKNLCRHYAVECRVDEDRSGAELHHNAHLSGTNEDVSAVTEIFESWWRHAHE